MPQLHRDLVLQGLDRLANEQQIEVERLESGEYKVEFTTRSEAVAMSLEIMRLQMLLAGRIYTAIDRAATEFKSQEKVRDLREKEKAVAEQYWIYRDQGMKHRVAIDCTHQISDVVLKMGWSKSDVGYCVRLFPREYFKLNLPKQEGVTEHVHLGWEEPE